MNLPWRKGLSKARQKALISMAFNLGVEGPMGFTKMLSALAAEEMLASKWAAQVGTRAMELVGMMEN